MSDTPSQQTLSGFDIATRVVSSASLIGTAIAATLLIPAVRGGLYGGTAVMVFMVVFVQILGFVAAVGVPSLVLLVRRRCKLSRISLWLLAFGLAGVIAEVVALIAIPKGSNC